MKSEKLAIIKAVQEHYFAPCGEVPFRAWMFSLAAERLLIEENEQNEKIAASLIKKVELFAMKIAAAEPEAATTLTELLSCIPYNGVAEPLEEVPFRIWMYSGAYEVLLRQTSREKTTKLVEKMQAFAPDVQEGASDEEKQVFNDMLKILLAI